MPLSSSGLRRAVHQALISTTGVPNPDRTQLTAAFSVLCDRFRQRLQPIFGTPATRALFTRAVHVAAHEYPWLNDLQLNPERCSLEGLDAPHLQLDSHTLAAGLSALLAHDIGLLTAFIGEDVVMPLVQDAWGDASIADRRHVSTEGES
jgi:hypothetical protein